MVTGVVRAPGIAGEFIRPLAAYLLVEIMWVIRTSGEAGLKVFVFQTITDICPFWGIAPVNALKPRCLVNALIGFRGLS